MKPLQDFQITEQKTRAVYAGRYCRLVSSRCQSFAMCGSRQLRASSDPIPVACMSHTPALFDGFSSGFALDCSVVLVSEKSLYQLGIPHTYQGVLSSMYDDCVCSQPHPALLCSTSSSWQRNLLMPKIREPHQAYSPVFLTKQYTHKFYRYNQYI